jgi:hypothetical protein
MFKSICGLSKNQIKPKEVITSKTYGHRRKTRFWFA